MKSRCCGPKLHGITQKGSARRPRVLAHRLSRGYTRREFFDITDAWDVTGAIDWTVDLVNNLRVVVQNNDPNGKKTKLNTIWLVVAYALP